MLIKKRELALYSLIFILIISLSYFAPKILIILATPSVYQPQTFDETYVEVSVFDIGEKVVVRANVSDSDASATPLDTVYMNITDANGNLKVSFDEMVDTGETCGTDCWIYEQNYTLGTGTEAPAGTWTIDVYANDTGGNEDTNSATFTVNVYLAIALSTPLAGGIEFGNLDPNTINSSSLTCQNLGCNISVSSDSNVNVDVVVKVNAPLTRQGGTETIETQYWNSSLTQQPSSPAYQFQTSYDYTHKVGSNLEPGSNVIFNTWVTIPGGQKAGVYNNTIYFCACKTGTSNC